MKYKNYSKNDLIERIRELEKTKKEDVNKRDELIKSQYFATGYLGPWHWNVKDDEVKLHSIQEEMFISKNNKKSYTFNYFLNLIHKDDRKIVKKEFDKHLKGEIPAVEVEYRIFFKDENYHWIYQRAEIDEFDEKSNKPMNVVGLLMDITEKRETLEQLSAEKKVLEKNSTIDFLTNLLNRRGLHSQSSDFIKNGMSKVKFSVAMFDIDNFKQANDTFGHEYGDQVLIDIADLLRDNTRAVDIVSRFGGDEFLIIFPKMILNTAYKVCERIRKKVQTRYQDAKIKITLSAGVKEYDGEYLKELIKMVDELLYKAKENGKNLVVK